MKLWPLYLCFFVSLIAACHKSNSARRVPGLYGQWRWVGTQWFFGPGGGFLYPGIASTTLLLLDSNSTYSILLNNKPQVTDTFRFSSNCPAVDCDSALTFAYSTQSSSSDADLPLKGSYLLSIHDDTLYLSQSQANPAGTAQIYSFLPYP
jgi:hypothetical protein